MSDVDLSAYESGFKPSFNMKRYKELLNNPPTNFVCGKESINLRKELVTNFLMGCYQLIQKVDENNILVGDEGAGKSHFSFQLAYVKHKLMTELGMINYPFSLDLIYYNIKGIITAFDKYAHIPYMIYVLDESDSLTRSKWNDPTVKLYVSKLRRERKNLRIVYMNMPQLSELLPTVTLTRVTMIFEITLKTEGAKLKRGQYNLFTIPRGQGSFSLYHRRFLDKNLIRNTIAKKLYSSEERYFNLPRDIISFQGNFNGSSPIDANEYLRRAMESNKEGGESDNPEMLVAKKRYLDDYKYDVINSMRRFEMTWKSIGTIFETTESNITMWHKRAGKKNSNAQT